MNRAKRGRRDSNLGRNIAGLQSSSRPTATFLGCAVSSTALRASNTRALWSCVTSTALRSSSAFAFLSSAALILSRSAASEG